MGTINDYRDREHWSFSAINQFLNICSLQFFFDRIARLPKAFTPVSLSFGSAFHRTCEWIGMMRKDGHQPKKADACELFHTLWGRQVAEDGEIRYDEEQDQESVSTQGRAMIGCLVDGMDPDEQVVSVNEAFAVPLVDAQGNVSDKPLVGEIDCRVSKGGKQALVDCKTSGRRWPKDQADKSLQPTVYLYAERQLYGQDIPVRFDVIVKNKTPVMEQHVTTRTVDQFHRMVELVKMSERMIQTGHFLPSEQSFYCAGCPHQVACRAWHREAARVTVGMAA
ncbi:MAG: PD-(D/E)XK nuclease family protein [Lentisphaerae bacterium]|nr:PD-(D/E)XK nuclease family protein [Lentisphaerota bacterium]